MNIKAAIITELIPFTVPEPIVDKAMIDTDADIDGLADYEAENKQFVYRAAFAALRSLRSIKSISEGGYSITYDAKEVLAKMKAIAKISGDQNLIDEVAEPVPTVSSPIVW